MPARIDISTEKIVAALEATGWHQAAAAKRLGISTKTLQRRLSANTAIWPQPPTDPAWHRAMAATVTLFDQSDPAISWNEVKARYVDHMLDVGGWIDDHREHEPKVLSGAETEKLTSLIAASEDQWEHVDAAAQLAEYRSTKWVRRLEAHLSALRAMAERFRG